MWLVPPFLSTATLSHAAEFPDMTVGRIFYVEGDLLRYVPGENDWTDAGKDSPFGSDDTLLSASGGMAELIVPNGVWIRIGNSTQIHFAKLDPDQTEMDIRMGKIRIYNKGPQAYVKVTSPFGYVLADPETTFDLYVNETSAEVVSIKGKVTFVHATTGGEYEVASGTPSVVADSRHVWSGEGYVNAEWNSWNMIRENFWLAKGEVRGRSAEYLPPSLQHEAYAFEENGKWEMVSYEGRWLWFWRPTTVAVGWSPFSTGRWIDWYGDQAWIPAEPFGYTTHHYGNWIYTNNFWYWAPPVVSLRIGFPLLDIGFFWSPGRVSWIYSGIYVGWIPLAPRETYYSHRNWGGPHTAVVSGVTLNRPHISIKNYKYANQAVIIPQNRLYGSNNYRNIRVNKISRTTVINNYRTAPVINPVIRDYSTISQRYSYTGSAARKKPDNTRIPRIRHNEEVILDVRSEKARRIIEPARSLPVGRISREKRVEKPGNVTGIPAARKTFRPKEAEKVQRSDLSKSENVSKDKPGVKPVQVRPVQPTPSVAPSRQAAPTGVPVQKKQMKPENTVPESTAQPVPSVSTPGRVTPEVPVPAHTGQRKTERAAPARHTRPAP
jgi:hypothetical protein